MVKMSAVVIFVVVVCAASVGLILLLSPQPVAQLSDIDIQDAPVPLGAEAVYNADLELLCIGSGSVEVSPYKSGYTQGESVMFTAHPLEGWKFDHWEGPLLGDGNQNNSVKIRMPDGAASVTAVFVRK